MGKYILKRCLSMIVILLATAFVIFTILYFTPGDPAISILGSDASPQELDNFREVLGLNDSYLVQLGKFYAGIFNLDFGISWTYNVPVFRELFNRFPQTLILGTGSVILSAIIGILLGVFAGTHGGKWQDSFTMGVAMIFVSCPDFWVALMMILLFSVRLNLLPAFGIDSWLCYIMPIVASSLPGIAVNARQMRSSILEVCRADFITTARAKGQKEKIVIRRHMLPNALTPVITGIGGSFARIISGTAVVEMIFAIPGVGTYMLSGVSGSDYPVIRACVMFFAVFTAIVMLLVDLAYAFIDPQIKSRYAKQRVSQKKVNQNGKKAN